MLQQKTQQDTIYVDENDQQQTTSERNLSNIKNKRNYSNWFFQNAKNEIQVVTMRKTIEKVPNVLPPEITSLETMFINTSVFNQDLSHLETSHITKYVRHVSKGC